MIIIQHRVNDLLSLRNTPKDFGVEVDVRSTDSDLYLSHDPFTKGVSFREYLEGYNHRLLVLNVKEDGLESACLELLNNFGVKDYFFLDQPIPSLVRGGLQGFRDVACRMSEFESIQSTRLQAPFANWVWVDFFMKPEIEVGLFGTLKSLGLKVCLVSPELHSIDRIHEVRELRDILFSQGVTPDAVCTKYPEKWRGLDVIAV
jgi:hypothetical protein